MKISSEANSASANELQETITKNVRVLIAAKSVNQEDLAEALGIAQSGLSRKVNRRTDWSSSDIANLASFFGISFADIVTPLPLFLPSGGADYYVHPNSSYIDPRAQQMQQRDLAVPAGVRYLRMPVEGEERIHGAVGPRAFVMPSPDSDLDGPGGLGPRFSARTRFGLPHGWTNTEGNRIDHGRTCRKTLVRHMRGTYGAFGTSRPRRNTDHRAGQDQHGHGMLHGPFRRQESRPRMGGHAMRWT